MPTRSSKAVGIEGLGAVPTSRPRSVFSNFQSPPPEAEASLERTPERVRPRRTSADGATRQTSPSTATTLQTGIDTALARAFLYRFLAAAFADPTTESWSWLCRHDTHQALESALGVLKRDDAARQTGVPPVSPIASSECGPLQGPEATPQNEQPAAAPDWHDARPTFTSEGFDAFQDAYLAAFGHAARGRCPLNEIEYGDLKADPLFQPHRLADLAAFYRAFGLEVAEDAGERHDHIALELEFMSVLAAKEAYALEHQLEADALAQCREAQRKFLREHLGRWTPAFARRLARLTDHAALRTLAEFTRGYVADECARFGVPAGSEDLLLRSVDPAAESLCASCGITHLPPGALQSDAAG